MTNRLARAQSTYLRQHADNPVDWQEWGPEAFAEAHHRNVPVLLSVGYASCHWCHVMAHESFEDPAIAAQINAHFVAIKVDREQRPDVDATYMAATQALTGQGGWPMTVFLTPDGEPYYAGTYFPPTPRSGLPGFGQVLTAAAEAWQNNTDEVQQLATQVAASLSAGMQDLPAVTVSGAELDRCRDALLAQIDRRNGGFGRAPKFPPAMTAEFLLRNHERTGSPEALDAVTLTLRHMALGGIYDQLAGAFARYSVDATWHVPHFEKMLDDNALLLRVYAHHARRTGSTLSRRIAEETGAFLLREMRTAQGAFAAALDADTEGAEGLTYRWSIDELRAALGGDDALTACEIFRIDLDRPLPEGDVLRLAEAATEPGQLQESWHDIRARLLAARDHRPQPGRDDIVVLRSNGLAIAALAEAGAALGRPEWVTAASEAADAVTAALGNHSTGDGWRRSALGGEVGPGRAMLADYAAFAAGLLALYQATGNAQRLTAAAALLDDMLDRFRDADGRWFDAAAPGESSAATGESSAATGEPSITRPRDPTDGAAPSGMSSAADALVTAAALTGTSTYRDAAEALLSDVGSLLLRFPRSAGWHLATAEALAQGPLQIAVTGPATSARDDLAAAARQHAPGGTVIDVGLPDAANRPLLADRQGIDGQPAAYVCRGFVCDRPVTTPAGLADQLSTG